MAMLHFSSSSKEKIAQFLLDYFISHNGIMSAKAKTKIFRYKKAAPNKLGAANS